MGENSEGDANVLLIILDSVRAANTSLCGYQRETTPFLEALADRSTVYEQARAPSIWSLPSHASIFTGSPPHVHGVNTSDQSLQSGHTIWEELERAGYSTGLFTSNVYLGQVPVGLDTPFGTTKGQGGKIPFPGALTPNETGGQTGSLEYLQLCIDDDETTKSLVNGMVEKSRSTLTQSGVLDRLLPQDDCTRHAENFIEWMQEQSGPWAACINFMDAHMPYRPDEEFDRWSGSKLEEIQSSSGSFWEYVNGDRPWWQCEALSSLYDGAIRQMDNEIENVVNRLRESGELENTHIVVTGDHGEGFGEFCYVRPEVRYAAHAYGIHDSLLHVPLLSKRPGQQCGDRIDHLSSLTSFGDVVRSTTGLGGGRDSFTVDEMLVSSIERTRQIDKNLQGRQEYRGDAYALYRDTGDEIRSYAKWGEDEATACFARTAQAPLIAVDRGSHGEVDRALRESEERSLRQDGPDADSFDEATKSQLEHLGYM